MSDITAGMPGLDYNERGLGQKPPEQQAPYPLPLTPNPTPNPQPEP